MVKVLLKLLFVLWLFFPMNIYALDRCIEYVPDVRSAHIRYFGLGFPYWYGLGQLQQESNCRANVTAFDAGMGLAQFMPATAKHISFLMKERLDPYNPEHATRMQAFYMNRLHKQNLHKKLFISYMYYNSGKGTVDKEIIRCGSIDKSRMREVCHRKVLTLKGGKKLDLCDVGYDYPVRIYKYGGKYKIGADGNFLFW